MNNTNFTETSKENIKKNVKRSKRKKKLAEFKPARLEKKKTAASITSLTWSETSRKKANTPYRKRNSSLLLMFGSRRTAKTTLVTKDRGRALTDHDVFSEASSAYTKKNYKQDKKSTLSSKVFSDKIDTDTLKSREQNTTQPVLNERKQSSNLAETEGEAVGSENNERRGNIHIRRLVRGGRIIFRAVFNVRVRTAVSRVFCLRSSQE